MRNKILKAVTVSLILLSLILFIPPIGATEDLAEISKPAPDFNLIGADGKEHKLSDYKGKIVVLEWFNHDCPFVKKHYHASQLNMQKLQKQALSKGMVWVSINSSAEGKQGHLTAQQAIQVTDSKGASPSAILLDSTGVVGKKYGAKTTPHMFIVDAQGILRYMGAIDDISSTDPSDIPNSKNYVSQALSELETGKNVSEPVTDAYGCSVKYGL